MNKDIVKDSIKCLSNAKLNDTTYEIARDIVIEQLNKYKEVLDKIKEYIKENACYDKDIKQCCRDLLTDECDYVLKLLEETE